MQGLSQRIHKWWLASTKAHREKCPGKEPYKSPWAGIYVSVCKVALGQGQFTRSHNVLAELAAIVGIVRLQANRTGTRVELMHFPRAVQIQGINYLECLATSLDALHEDT